MGDAGWVGGKGGQLKNKLWISLLNRAYVFSIDFKNTLKVMD